MADLKWRDAGRHAKDSPHGSKHAAESPQLPLTGADLYQSTSLTGSREDHSTADAVPECCQRPGSKLPTLSCLQRLVPPDHGLELDRKEIDTEDLHCVIHVST